MFDWNGFRTASGDQANLFGAGWRDAAERLAAQVAASQKQLIGLMQQSFGAWPGGASTADSSAPSSSSSAFNPFAIWGGLPSGPNPFTAWMSRPASDPFAAWAGVSSGTNPFTAWMSPPASNPTGAWPDASASNPLAAWMSSASNPFAAWTSSSASNPFVAWMSSSAPYAAAFTKSLAGLPHFGLSDLMGQLASHPALVGNRDSIERLVPRVMQAWASLQQAAVAHQLVMASGWQQAFSAFAAEFQGVGEAREIRTLEAYLGLWSEVGERALQAHARSAEYVDSQARMIRAGMQYRLEARRVTEAVCRLQDLPTLTDLDEAFAMIHELRREVRLLKRRLGEDEPSR
jgi:hypothetical protein